MVDEPDSTSPPVREYPEAVRERRQSSGVAGWLVAALVVLVLAAAAGLFTAWVVANMRAVPGPVGGVSTPAPGGSFNAGGSSALPSTGATVAPRRTPTAAPTVNVTAQPFVHVVQRGESLFYIATLYQVDVQDIIDLNKIDNPNRISVGDELLIPGYGVQPTPKPSRRPK